MAADICPIMDAPAMSRSRYWQALMVQQQFIAADCEAFAGAHPSGVTFADLNACKQ